MRLRVLSDLHIEFEDFRPPPADADVVILAGDIGLGVEGVAWAKQRFPDVPVLYVAGNHEFYGGDLPGLIDELRAEARGSSVHVLEDDALHLGGITFLGATLWTDLCLYGNLAMGAAFARTGMSDYRLIQLTGAGRPLDPLDTAALFQQSAAWLDEAMGAARGPVVVVTHHAPSARSLGAHWEGHPLNVAFCSDLEAHIGRHQPALWVHGHMHDAFDYTLGRTRVLCNPRGYPGERGEGFDPRLVVEIPT